MNRLDETRFSGIINLLLTLAFVISAIYHFIALIIPTSFPESPAWRHLLFIVINAMFFILVIRRWIWFWLLFCLLTIQQLISHGGRAYDWWVEQHRVDYVSIIIIIFMPLVSAILYYDFKLRIGNSKI